MSPLMSIVPEVWSSLRKETASFRSGVLPLDSFVASLGEEKTLGDALAKLLARQIEGPVLDRAALEATLRDIYEREGKAALGAAYDLKAVTARDPASDGMLRAFLFFKGFHALQLYRAAHAFWLAGQKDFALFLQNRVSIVFGVDIHPAALIGYGIMFDHATGIVIGETAIVEDNVSMLHGVTLGGTGKERGDRHPKIRRDVMIGADATILGNIEIGEGAVVAAGSMVLNSIPPHVTVAGVPARIVGKPKSQEPSCEMDQTLPEGDALSPEQELLNV